MTLPFNNPLTGQLDFHGIWQIEFFVSCSVILFALLKLLKLTFFQRALSSYVLIYCLWIFEYPTDHFGIYTTAYQLQAARVFVEWIGIGLAAWFFSARILQVLPIVVVFELFAVVFARDGLLVAPSFNSALCALAIPFLPPWAIVCVLGVILTHHGSTALMILGAQLTAYLLSDKRLWKWIIPVFISLLSIAYLHHHGPWLDGSERLQKYEEFLTFWKSRWEWVVFGVGPGSFIWTSLVLDEFKGNLFLQMHSDFLQILWEWGVLGLALSLMVFIEALRSAWQDLQLRAALFGVAAFTFTYHPFRWMPSALLMSLILINCKKRSDPFLLHLK